MSCGVEAEVPLRREELLAPVRGSGGPLRSLAFLLWGQPRILVAPGALERALSLPLRRTAAAGVSIAVFLHLAAAAGEYQCRLVDCEDQVAFWLRRARAAVASLPGTVTVEVVVVEEDLHALERLERIYGAGMRSYIRYSDERPCDPSNLGRRAIMKGILGCK